MQGNTCIQDNEFNLSDLAEIYLFSYLVDSSAEAAI